VERFYIPVPSPAAALLCGVTFATYVTPPRQPSSYTWFTLAAHRQRQRCCVPRRAHYNAWDARRRAYSLLSIPLRRTFAALTPLALTSSPACSAPAPRLRNTTLSAFSPTASPAAPHLLPAPRLPTGRRDQRDGGRTYEWGGWDADGAAEQAGGWTGHLRMPAAFYSGRATAWGRWADRQRTPAAGGKRTTGAASPNTTPTPNTYHAIGAKAGREGGGLQRHRTATGWTGGLAPLTSCARILCPSRQTRHGAFMLTIAPLWPLSKGMPRAHDRRSHLTDRAQRRWGRTPGFRIEQHPAARPRRFLARHAMFVPFSLST